MLYNILYYTLSTTAVIASACGICYLIDPDTTRCAGITISWEALKLYHGLKLNYSKRFIKKEKKDEEKKLEEKKDIFMGYNISDDTTYKSEDFNESYLKDNDFDIMIVIQKDEEDKELYKRINDKSELNNYSFDKGDRIFLQVELEQGGDRISIHNNLEEFYLDKNKILDKVFLEWYLKKFYYMDLHSSYKLHIIDSEINMFNINERQGIELFIENDELKYKII